MVVIIGAGPSGLYTAIQLKKAGVEDVVVYDPRAGEYVRPGHINSSVLERAESGLGVKFNFPNQIAHIKDIERVLWTYALSLNIPIEQKAFVGFDQVLKGVIVVDKEGNEERIACDYVIDCTGSQRQVINAVNKCSQAATKPFKTSFVTEEITIKNHLLLYVSMDERTLRVSETVPTIPRNINMPTMSFVRSIERLRQLGWHEFAWPLCYGISFGKGKVCFYVETPDALPPEQKEVWFQAVLEARTGDKAMRFKLLPDSKKYKSKPRLNTFLVNPVEVSPLSHQEPGLPMVITQGDAQIDPNHYLAHGIIDSFDRIDKMIKGMMISKSKINYFGQQKYEQDVLPDLKTHREALIGHYKERKKYFIDWLHIAKKSYEYAITKFPDENPIFVERLKELQARIACHNVLKIFQDKFLVDPAINTLLELREAKDNLTVVLQKLTNGSKEQEDVNLQLKLLLTTLKDVGKTLYQKDSFSLALGVYKEALNVSRIQAPRDEAIELFLHSKIVSCYRKLHLGKTALSQAREVLETYSCGPEIEKKILFNGIKAIMEEFSISKEENKMVTKISIRMVANFYCQHQKFIQQYLGKKLNPECSEMISILGNCDSLREQGEQFFKQGKYDLAMISYQDALLTHRLSTYPSQKAWEDNLCASMMVIYRKINRLSEGIPFANEILTNPDLLTETKKKILFNVVKGWAEAIPKGDAQTKSLELSFTKEIKQFYMTHKEFLESELQDALKIELNILDSLFDPVISESMDNFMG